MYRGYEFIVIQDIMTRNEVTEELEMVREDAPVRWYCSDLSLITDVEQIYNMKGSLKKGYCRVYHSILGDKVVRCPYSTVVKMLAENTITYFNKDN